MPRPAISRRHFLSGLATLTATTALPATLAGRRSGPAAPNLLLLSVDGISSTDLGCYGGADTATPHLDALARQGARFTDFHAASPVRDPSHLAVLSGRHPRRFSASAAMAGSHQISHQETDLPLPGWLRDAGYAVGLSSAGREGGALIQVGRPIHEPTRFFPAGNETEAAVFNESLADQAADFIGRERGRYFLDLHFAGDFHFPAQPAQRRQRMELLDATLGRVIAAARARNPHDDLLVAFAGSCGPWNDEVAGFRGGRGTLWEGGHRVPALLAWPGHIDGGRDFSFLTSNLDLCPTLLAAARIDYRGMEKFDGLNLLPCLAQGLPAADRTLCWSYSGSRAVREGKWKYLFNRAAGPKGAQLFDLAADPGEQVDLQSTQAARATRMAAYLRSWENSLVS